MIDDSVHGSDESIAPAGQGLYVMWLFGIVLERLAELLNRRIDAVIELDECTIWPKTFPDLFAEYRFARVFQQHQQNFKRLLLQPDPPVSTQQLSRPCVQLKVAETRRFVVLGFGYFAARHRRAVTIAQTRHSHAGAWFLSSYESGTPADHPKIRIK